MGDDMPIENATEQPFGSIGRQVNKILDQVQKGYYSFYPADTWTPSVNLYEVETGYRVCVDLSGVEKEKIDITIAGQRLTLKGHRQVPCHPDGDGEIQTKRVRVHLMEIDQGSFSREVELPDDANPDSITAIYRNGLLWIELPRKEGA
jgi:HSP20 family protein